ncbi:DegT/DnrJ/EryC1/StrS family aminotransferase [Halobellus sp. Atlit-38R]|uniref:DegT/DnrJ/EryC1/StrS family aminotransferase n=1 Tax=Halobellus sp. Atlit-38R TaxID=2282131 RepID=UPI000EF17840|nr:DegT/DnrJ/EryC1/StrS family aminotransferase [Halobellus sp. Atlit-38R]RLM83634.1 DegT/DnrJ/EryC1/StrS family aminotransferase [Halobellus sp. Atlit-38R]
MIPIANPQMGAEEHDLVADVLDSGMLADGPEVRAFEEEFAEFCDVDHAVATANGTTALHAAFEALGIGEGDRVLTTPFSFVASANAIRLAGAKPVFADVRPDTYNLDPDSVRDVLESESVDAILAVHLYGLPADLDALADIADDHGLPLVEDAAQAHGATVEGQKVGSIGDVGCFSFYPTKNMTTGEGGMITTDDEEIAARAASFINHGRSMDGGSYEHVRLGHNFRMTSVAAALGRAQLERLPEYTERRRENAAVLTEQLEETAVTTPVEPAGRMHVYHQYTIRHEDRDALKTHLEEQGVGSAVYYPTCIHEQPAYDHVTHESPVAERASREVLSLPVHPNVDETDIETITDAVRSYTEGKR